MSDVPLTVLVVDGRSLVAEGLAALLREAGFVAEAWDGPISGWGDAVAERRTRVVVVDATLDELERVAGLLRTDLAARVVVLAPTPDADLLDRAIGAGCSAFVTKDATAADLVRAVRAADAGAEAFPADDLIALVQHRDEQARRADPGLTTRELEVLRLVAAGRTTVEIAGALGLSVHTVRNHVRRALRRLGVHSKLDAVVAAARLGLIGFDGPTP